MKRPQSQVRAGFTLVELLVVIAIIGILVGLLLPAVQAAREAARRMSCSNNVKQLALAFHNYHDTYKKFPAYQYNIVRSSGNVSSWRGHGGLTMILPYIEQQPLYDQVDWTLEWDGGNNGNPVARTKIDAMLCPTDMSYPDSAWGGNNYGLNGGSRRAFYSTGSPVKASGAFARRSETAFRDLTDGTSNVILLAEFLKGDNSGSQLDLERDFTNSLSLGTDQFPTQADIETAGVACDGTAAGYQVSNAGRSWMASFPGWIAINTIAPPNWKHVNCCTGGGFGYACDRDGIVPARSLHPGGVMCAMSDGAVKFAAETVDFTLWQHLGARGDGNPASLP